MPSPTTGDRAFRATLAARAPPLLRVRHAIAASGPGNAPAPTGEGTTTPPSLPVVARVATGQREEHGVVADAGVDDQLAVEEEHLLPEIAAQRRGAAAGQGAAVERGTAGDVIAARGKQREVARGVPFGEIGQRGRGNQGGFAVDRPGDEIDHTAGGGRAPRDDVGVRVRAVFPCGIPAVVIVQVDREQRLVLNLVVGHEVMGHQVRSSCDFGFAAALCRFATTASRSCSSSLNQSS